jgi:hypothetical protein
MSERCNCGRPLDYNGLCECKWFPEHCDCQPLRTSKPSVVRNLSTASAADIHPIPIEWLWSGYVPRAMVSILGGFPGVGKSTVGYDLAARTSREGRLVVIATAEDHLAAVVRPRLEAAGADLDLVRIVLGDITLPENAAMVTLMVRELDAAMVMLDPLVAFIGDDVNTHRDHQVRRVLAPLSELAEVTGAAVVVIVHTNKGRETEPLMRISGSIGFTGAARTVLLAADDPKDDARRILAVVKSNLAEFPPPLAYRIVGVEMDGGIRTSRIEWLGEAGEVDVRELLAGQDAGERSDRETAMEFLRESGVKGEAQPAADLMKAAAAMNIGEKTLQRARRSLAIPAWCEFVGGPWWWGPRRLDTPSGHPYPSHAVQSALPAETPRRSPRLDSVDRVGGGPDGACPECGFRWFHGHAEDCSRRSA